MSRLTLVQQKLRELNPKEYYKQFYEIESKTNCWLWKGNNCVNEDGYVKIREGYFHVVIWEIHNKKKKPKGFELDHLCKVRRCGNPDHLELVTILINRQRSNKTKVKPEQRIEILRRKLAGERVEDIAPDFNITHDHIYKIIRMGY